MNETQLIQFFEELVAGLKENTRLPGLRSKESSKQLGHLGLATTINFIQNPLMLHLHTGEQE